MRYEAGDQPRETASEGARDGARDRLPSLLEDALLDLERADDPAALDGGEAGQDAPAEASTQPPKPGSRLGMDGKPVTKPKRPKSRYPGEREGDWEQFIEGKLVPYKL